MAWNSNNISTELCKKYQKQLVWMWKFRVKERKPWKMTTV